MEQSKKETRLDDVIAIDGPAGSGKSTVAKLLAQKLEFSYIDTGAMYRALTLKALRERIDLKNEEKLIDLAERTEIDLINTDATSIKVLLDGEDVTALIRTPELTNNISYIARVEGVRKKMKQNQQRIGSRGRCVFEGRDIGTVVFPNARYKFYLDADFEERVKRRYKELIEKNPNVSYDEVSRDLRVRDNHDMSRKVAPLKRAEDAVYIDTTNLSIQEVVEKLANYIREQ